MKHLFLISPQAANALIKEDVYQKGQLKLSIISTWKKCVVLAESIPKSKMIDGIKFTEFKNIDFKENRSGFTRKLILPSEMDKSAALKLKRIFRDGFTWVIEREGWRHKKSSYKLRGEFSANSVPVHNLTLATSEIELVYRAITPSEFEDFSKNGMPRSLFEDSVETSSPIFDDLTSLTIDEVEIPYFNKDFKIKYDQAIDQAKFEPLASKSESQNQEIKYAVIGESWIKRAWYDLTIFESFDLSKLNISISRNYIYGKNIFYDTFDLAYDGVEFEFRENWGASSSQFALIDNRGNESNLILFDDEDGDSEDEDGEDGEDGDE